VLSPFFDEEQKQLSEIIDKATEMCLSFGTIGLERTMNFFNK
jgi:PTH1 family peptidyl-tRNA hydrolase